MDRILIANQHGFRKNLSCTSQLLTTTQTIIHDLDKGGCVQAVVLDFAKAFDKVPHDKLIEKLRTYDFPDDVTDWILDFLSNRKQRVVIDGVYSDFNCVTSGVPQGSVLGPALFLLYINDIAKELKSDIRLYADDALMHMTLRNASSIIDFQADLFILENWAKKWGMAFNISKCALVFFGTFPPGIKQDMLNYTLCAQVLQKVDSFKYLGVLIQSNLKWDEHINKKVSEATRTLGLIRRSLFDAPKHVKLIAYQTLCRPKLEYAVEVWDPFLRKHIDLLESVQNKAVRFVLKLRGICSITNSREQLGLATLKDRRYRQRIKTYDFVMGQSGSHKSFDELNSLIDLCFPDKLHTTRSVSHGCPIALSANTNIFHQSFIPRTTRELRLSFGSAN